MPTPRSPARASPVQPPALIRMDDRPIEAVLDCPAEYFVDLIPGREELEAGPPARAPEPDLAGRALHRESIQDDLAALIDETYVRGILAERLHLEAQRVSVTLTPVRESDLSLPGLQGISVRVTDDQGGSFELVFRLGPWVRRAQELVPHLRKQGVLAENRHVYLRLQARAEEHASLPRLFLQAPEVRAGSLADLGLGAFSEGEDARGGGGELDPARPLLVSATMLEEIRVFAEHSGVVETGGATLGSYLRLAQPLPGTTTRIVTVLTASFLDVRHRGAEQRFTFSPEAMAEAAQLAELRRRGERVVTAFHSHGWGTGCNRCHSNERCVLPVASEVSLDDYDVAERLFPGKATVLPIVGRKLGARGERPVLEVHAWLGGALRPLPWRACNEAALPVRSSSSKSK